MNILITRLLLFFIPTVLLSNLVRFEVVDVAVTHSMLIDKPLKRHERQTKQLASN